MTPDGAPPGGGALFSHGQRVFSGPGRLAFHGTVLEKTALLYGAGVLLYLPLNWYAGQLSLDFPRQVLFDGSFYHLWYLPALLLGAPIAWLLNRLGQKKALLIAGGLYLIGLGGGSYYGPLPESVAHLYNTVFRVFAYTRNGLFYVPLFLLLGAAGITLGRRESLWGGESPWRDSWSPCPCWSPRPCFFTGLGSSGLTVCISPSPF